MRGHIRGRLWVQLAVIAALFFSSSAQADARIDYLVRLLEDSDAFRVRAQAALSLGRLEPTRESIAALEGAVRDSHPAVRVAAISSLQGLRVTSSIGVLKKAVRDRNARVRRAASEAVADLKAILERPRSGPGKPKFYVAVGLPGARPDRVTRQMRFDAQLFVSEQLLQVEGVELVPEGQSAAEAKRQIERRRLRGYFLDSSVVKLERKGGAVRAQVSVIVSSYPGRDMKAILSGAARAPGRIEDEDTAVQAIQGAFVGALRKLPQTFRATQ